MSEYRVCLITLGQQETANHIDFDNKEDAEHYAKNKSSLDNKHRYEIQKNHHGQFSVIKSYLNGQVI